MLLEACQFRKERSAKNPSEYAEVLNKLGQFDLDQNDFKSAEPELAEALKVARHPGVKSEAVLLCLRSYANLLRQTNRKAESQKLFKEADAIEGKAPPATDE